MRDPRAFDEYLQSDSKLFCEVQPRYFPIKEIAGFWNEPDYILFSFGYNVLKPLVSMSVNFKLERIILKLRTKRLFSLPPAVRDVWPAFLLNVLNG